ncbi:hypothetical protein F5I97DRAFT_1107580 [Phlebopus sp. FC_14]|nr:hypothetical protein F5I97DRAFT_1107580 [Phlebopus sp. FC_14]
MMITASSSRITRSSKKRKRNDEDEDHVGLPPPAKVYEEVDLVTQVPTITVNIFKYDGLLIDTGPSIRGRGTAVSAVHRRKVRVALNMTWQDIAREPQRDDSLVVVLCAQNEVHAVQIEIEDHTLEIYEAELRRPVGLFWSIQDFVLGLRGALLGHQYLVKNNMLHRDVSENNVFLACEPGQPRGCLMDFDMAVRYQVSEQTPEEADDIEILTNFPSYGSAPKESHKGPFKAERTGTIPYMSMNVLQGKRHTHYDDIESFFYVLLLFFISYKGPLPTSDLDAAHRRGFNQVTGSGRAQNICDWPERFRPWSETMLSSRLAKLELLTREQSSQITYAIAVLMSELWGSTLYPAIGNLVAACLRLFQGTPRVTHDQFIGVLDNWLKAYPAPPDGCNNCPFKDSEGRPYI